MSKNSVEEPPSPQLALIDTHCHLDDETFQQDLGDVLTQSQDAGVTRWIVVGFAPDRWQSSLDLGRRHPGVSVMLGVHPGHADEWTPETAGRLAHLIEVHRPVAIGEIGLDFFRGDTNHDQQRRALRDQLALARTFDLPVAIHMRAADDEMRELLDGTEDLPRLLFHSFDGSPRTAEWIRQHDAWIGVGGLFTRSSQTALRSFIAEMPQNRVVLETDSPYLVPNGFKHLRNTPESIPIVATRLADLWGASLEHVAQTTTRNAETLFPRIVPS